MSWISKAVHAQAIFSVVLLIAFLIASTVLQQRASQKVTVVLNAMSDDVKKTQTFASAMRYFKRRQVSNLFTSGVHAIPIWFLIFVVTCCSIATYFGAEYLSKITSEAEVIPSYVLGGAYASTDMTPSQFLNRYQSGTVFMASTAFLGAYIWTISQLVNRINNNDMNPMTYHFLSIRIISACLVAGIARHIFEAMPWLGERLEETAYHAPVRLAILGFLIGWNPTLWINEILMRAGDLIKTQIPSQRWPKKENLPLNLTLLMVQGMMPDTSDRLKELNIDNCQKLASENSVILWIRTSYTLELIIDWIAQAQLCVLFEHEILQKLRAMGVRDIFSYRIVIGAEISRDELSKSLEIPKSILLRQIESIDSCPCYARLAELRIALMP